MISEFFSVGDIFIEGEIFEEYAYFGWGDDDAQFYMYIEGYKLSGDTLLDIALDSKDSSVKDKLIFPIVFSYRQYVELKLKKMYIDYCNQSRDHIVKILNKKGHKILGLWNLVYPIIIENIGEEIQQNCFILEKHMKEIHDYDMYSDSFRYPVNRDHKLHHQKWEYLDLVNLKEKFIEIYNCFDYMDLKMDQDK